MTESESKPEIKKGLKNVYIDKTKSSFIDGKEGKLIYRGYNIHDLASNSTFEEIVYLLINGSLPNKAELDQIDSELRAIRKINEGLEVYNLRELSSETYFLLLNYLGGI